MYDKCTGTKGRNAMMTVFPDWGLSEARTFAQGTGVVSGSHDFLPEARFMRRAAFASLKRLVSMPPRTNARR
jgi:hypothetical protein